MPRPPLPLGTHGAISHYGEPPKVRAKTRVRDLDGTTRVVTRWGRNKTAATNSLLEAVRDRHGNVGAGITRETKLAEVAAEWLTEVEASDRADGTKGLFRRTVNNYLTPGIGQLRVYETTVPVLERVIETIREHHGTGAARTYRQVLSGVLGLAVRHGAIPANPVREVSRSTMTKRAAARALTREETTDLLAALDNDEQAREHDLPDLARFMLATGVRLGEALALRWDYVDLDGGVVTIAATVTDAKGRGTFIQESTKTRAGHRVLAVPADVIAILTERRGRIYPDNDLHLVFPTVLGTLRNRGRTTTQLRRALDNAGFPWATSHTFRKTAATRLDEAGLSARKIADQLGHERPSMTSDVYMGRRVVTSEAAEVLSL
ncbi:tyrosine-type recombinase/integrase [Dietzia timorensis]|nr:site-specific integrase [Dietzia timorensis]